MLLAVLLAGESSRAMLASARLSCSVNYIGKLELERDSELCVFIGPVRVLLPRYVGISRIIRPLRQLASYNTAVTSAADFSTDLIMRNRLSNRREPVGCVAWWSWRFGADYRPQRRRNDMCFRRHPLKWIQSTHS